MNRVPSWPWAASPHPWRSEKNRRRCPAEGALPPRSLPFHKCEGGSWRTGLLRNGPPSRSHAVGIAGGGPDRV